MKIKNLILLGICSSLFIALTSSAADLTALSRLFRERFNTDWIENRCGENTARFVKAAAERNIDLTRSVIIGAEDVMGYFGMISGYQAREGGAIIRPEPKNPPYHQVGRLNWYFHAFMIAQETVNVRNLGAVAVYDLSFMNEPTVLNLTRYLDLMYLPEKTFGDPITRTKTFKYFKFSIYDAQKYVTLGQSPSKIKESTYLREVFPSFYSSQNPDENEFFENTHGSRLK